MKNVKKEFKYVTVSTEFFNNPDVIKLNERENGKIAMIIFMMLCLESTKYGNYIPKTQDAFNDLLETYPNIFEFVRPKELINILITLKEAGFITGEKDKIVLNKRSEFIIEESISW